MKHALYYAAWFGGMAFKLSCTAHDDLNIPKNCEILEKLTVDVGIAKEQRIYVCCKKNAL